MNELKDYHHHNLDTNKIEYSTNQNENNNTSNNNNSVVHTTILNTTSNPLTTESSFHPINIDHNKKLTSATGTSSSSSSSSIPLILPQLLPTPESNSTLNLQSISLQATSSSISNGSAASGSISLGDSQRLSEQHQNNHHQQQTHQPHWYSPHHHHHLSHPHQLEEQNFLVYASNSNKLHDGPDGYLNTRYNNVKGIRNERTSSNFFDIPAATHHPYCYRFPSPPGLLKKELGEDRYTNHPSTLHLSQHHFHHHHHHHQIEHPDSTTNLTVHQQTLNQTTSSSPTSSPSDIPDYSPYNNGNTGYTIRPSESAIVSSTEPEIGFGTLYSTCSPISSNNSVNQRRGSLQLWQFLVTLLDEPTTSSGCIAWTGRGMEFKLIEPEEVARRWGLQKNRPAMNYDKLSRSLRYYYEKGIMQKVAGERYVYKFVCDPEALFNMAYGHMNGNENNYTISNNSKTINNNINNNNNNNNNNILSITDSHHQHHQNISSSELCTNGGGKLNSMYNNNNSFLHNNFK